jgi:hypothetical protein
VKFSGMQALSPDPEPLLMALLGYAQAVTGQTELARQQLAWLRSGNRA